MKLDEEWEKTSSKRHRSRDLDEPRITRANLENEGVDVELRLEDFEPYISCITP